MMSETLHANNRMDHEDRVRPLAVLAWAMIFGWTVGVLMGLGLGVALAQ